MKACFVCIALTHTYIAKITDISTLFVVHYYMKVKIEIVFFYENE